MIRFHFSLTWECWDFLIYLHPRRPYFTLGIGPAFLEVFWGRSTAPWEE